MAEHTKGPWIAHPVQRWVSPAADPEMPVCALRYESYGVECDEAEVRANAHLIAAAPDLLEALEGAIGALEMDHDAGKDMGDADWEGIAYQRLEAARAAIAKARNHPKGSH